MMWTVYLAVLLALVAGPAKAFGPTGHRVAGLIAVDLVCEPVRQELTTLLEPGESLADAGNWADRIRDHPEWSRSGPWHYLNVPDGGSPERMARRSPDNVLAALDRFEAQLLDRTVPRDKRATALRFVTHLVVDIHQPLHIGREGDRGGNTIPIRLNGRVTDLHAVWDGQALIGEDGLKASQHARSLAGLITGERQRWQAAEPADWAQESLDYRPQVYDFKQGTGKGGTGQPVTLSRTYLKGARNVVNLRLAQAGVRLAGRLNRLGCGAASPAGLKKSPGNR